MLLLMKITAVCLCSLLVLPSTDTFACRPDICNLVDCMVITPETCNGRIVRHGGYCGCCDACVSGLMVGEACVPSPLLGAPTDASCGPNLYCDSTTLTCQALPLVS